MLFTSFATATPPNVIVLMADDQGWGDLSCHGNIGLQTPHLDRLAAEGATFKRFYVQPVCAPTRAEFLTGRYHPRDGVRGVSEGRERLDPGVPTIADAFRSAGYATAAFGKWHNGTQAPYHPLCRGFDEFYGFTSGHWGHYFDFWLDRNGQLVKGNGYTTDDFTSEAIRFVERNQQRPFFALVAYNTPHSPMQVPDEWWRRHADQDLELHGTHAEKENQQQTRAALAMCENLDGNVGRLLKRLEELNQLDDTIIVFLSDNGPNGHRWNAGFRGIKGSVDEGGVRSPISIRYPKKIRSGLVVEQNAAAIDLLPTLAEFASVEISSSEALDGVSHAAALSGKSIERLPRQLFSHWGGRTAVREGRYLLDAERRLYDLDQDPNQHRDLAGELTKISEQLNAAIDTWEADLGVDQMPDPQPFTVGHPAMQTTFLPARDGTAHGAVTRSNRYPNCTYFSGWRTNEDRIQWDVEVLTEGTYEASVYLAADDATAGDLLTMSCGRYETSATLPPIGSDAELGPQHDRLPRAEGYVKDFRPFSIGTITLPQGRQSISVRVATQPESNGPAIWQLVLTRTEEK